jgi:hypothetical protein
MPVTPTNEPVQDPWRIPEQGPGQGHSGVPVAKKTVAKKSAAKKSAAARPSRPRQAAAQRARLVRDQRIAARITWPMVRGWMLAGVITRVLSAGILACFGLEYLHLHSLYVSAATTGDQWNAAAHTATELGLLNYIVILGMTVPSQAWVRTRVYLAKLPGVAPHPMQATNATYRALRMPALWPPVPEGAASWTRRVHWRVPPVIYATLFAFVLFGGLLDRLVPNGPGRLEFACAADLAAVLVALLAAALDVVRLRAYSRWPGRPATR